MIAGGRRRLAMSLARFGVLLAIAAGAAGCAARSANSETAVAAPRPDRAAFDLDQEAMQADLDAWLSMLEAVHPNPYSKIDRATFLAELDATRLALPAALDPMAFYGRLQRLAALLRDSHTEVWYPRT